MPAVKLRKRISPTNQFNRALQQVNGLYVHSSPPKGHYRLMADVEELKMLYIHTCPPRVLQLNPSVMRQWLRGGEIEQLEQVVLEGQGHKLIGEYSPDPRVRHFLKIVPSYMAKISDLNEAVNRGDSQRLKALMAPENLDPMMKNIILCKDHAGVGLLHKAVYSDKPKIVKWLVSNYPQTVPLKDRDGKTALHYCGVCESPESMWTTLVNAGADPAIMDVRGRTAAHYIERPGDIELPEAKLPSGGFKRFTSGKEGLVVKPSNIRIWIHDRDLGRLQQVLWEGHGGKLRVETSNNAKVKRFLDGVPYIMNAIKATHAAVVNNDYEQFMKKTSEPIPVDILCSKDGNGLNTLHKAAGLGNWKIVESILERNPKTIFASDHDGRTPLHYAAALKDGGAMYNLLLDNGADEMAFDQHGRMASYYKANPKDLPGKLLEVVPDAPRTALAFPPTWDWSVLQPTASISAAQMFTNGKPMEKTRRLVEDFDPKLLNPPDDVFDEPLKPVETMREEPAILKRERSNVALIEKIPSLEKADNVVDIWTNDLADNGVHHDDDAEEEPEHNGENYENDEFEAEEPQFEHREGEIKPNGKMEGNKERTEREIGEERQRLVDEGLLKLPAPNDDDDVDDGSVDVGESEVRRMIREGEMEKLASMVLNGNGAKLVGRKSNNPEIQGFLENVPSYMAKIKAVHKAARDGELREMQAALDRRRFAVAKDSENGLEMTPLHVATLFGRTSVMKYLGGRFPETLNAKDKNGRTPLHYAATVPDNGHYFNILLNLGSDRKAKDNIGNTPSYYMDNPGKLTQDTLLREYNAPAQVAREMLSDKVPNDMVSSRRHLQDTETLTTLKSCMDLIKKAREEGSTLPLVNHLKKEIYEKVKHRITKNDKTLLDVIWPGVRILQEGSQQSYEEADDLDLSEGIVASDFETYVVFEDLMVPMVKDLHNLGGKIHLKSHPGTMFFKKQATTGSKDVHESDNGGIVAPDYESYKVYKEVMIPIVKDIHGVEHKKLSPHPQSKFYNKNNQDAQPSNDSVKEIRVTGMKPKIGKLFEGLKQKVTKKKPEGSEDLKKETKATDNPKSAGKEKSPTEHDRLKTALIRQKPTQNQPYKLTRTQKLREEMKIKQEEESKRKAKEEEDDKRKWNRREKEVNILVLDDGKLREEKSRSPVVSEESESEDNGEYNSKEEEEGKHSSKIEEEENSTLEVYDLDPTGKYILSGKIECSRNLEKFQLPACLREEELEWVERKLKSALKYQSIVGTNLEVNKASVPGFGSRNMEEDERYHTVESLLMKPSAVRTKLAAHELLVPLDTGTFHSNMLHGRFWPGHRGVYLAKNGNLAAWINVQEHLRVISCTPIEAPGCLGEAYGRLAQLISALDKHLPPRRDSRLGFLTSRPSCLGNTLRMQVVVRLPRLSREQPGALEGICLSRGLKLSKTKDSDSTFKIRNRQSLGVTEYDTYHDFTSSVVNLIDLERALAQEKSKQVSNILKNIFTKGNFLKDRAEASAKRQR